MSTDPCLLTTCLGLMWYVLEGAPSCPCRMTEMICSSVLAPLLQLPCYQGDPATHVGSTAPGHISHALDSGSPMRGLHG